jgi:hypothetical protein
MENDKWKILFDNVDRNAKSIYKEKTRRALPFATGSPLVAYLRYDRGD